MSASTPGARTPHHYSAGEPAGVTSVPVAHEDALAGATTHTGGLWPRPIHAALSAALTDLLVFCRRLDGQEPGMMRG